MNWSCMYVVVSTSGTDKDGIFVQPFPPYPRHVKQQRSNCSYSDADIYSIIFFIDNKPKSLSPLFSFELFVRTPKPCQPTIPCWWFLASMSSEMIL